MKIARHRGSPESIGRGMAIGCFTAFFIPFSLQMPIAFILSVRLHAARIVALLVTWITNPLTIPFLYPLQCYVGARMIGHDLSYPIVQKQLADVIAAPSLKLMATLGTELVVSFMLGGLLFGTIAAIIGYYATVPWVRWKRKQQEQRKLRRAKAAAAMPGSTEHSTGAS